MPGPLRFTLHKSERLSSERRIDALFSGGRSESSGPLRCCWKETGAADETVETPTGHDGAQVSVLFSAPKKSFRRAWMRNLIKRRMRESYRTRKHSLIAATEATGRHIDIAFICQPAGAKGTTGTKGTTGGKGAQKSASGKVAARVTEIPDFKTIDHAVARILEKILARS